MITVESHGEEGFLPLSRINSGIKMSINMWLYKLGNDLYRSMFKDIKIKPRFGRKYRVTNPLTKRRFIHTASLPGETAADMFGNYAKGLSYVVSGNQMIFGDSVPYAAHLELGTGSRGVSRVRVNKKRYVLSSFVVPRAPQADRRNGRLGIHPRPGLAISIAKNERNAHRDAVNQISVQLELD